MSVSNAARDRRRRAKVFAALGDGTRLTLVAKLCEGESRSISELTEDARVTRQAITKHLKVLEGAGLVRGARQGRECRFELVPEPLSELRAYLDLVSRQWDGALARLRSIVET